MKNHEVLTLAAELNATLDRHKEIPAIVKTYVLTDVLRSTQISIKQELNAELIEQSKLATAEKENVNGSE